MKGYEEEEYAYTSLRENGSQAERPFDIRYVEGCFGAGESPRRPR